ncbi:MAG: GFA family protein, partial [Asticcacaulis sp.]|nr:GFA family protein [Asticcacaulis sp.]
LSPSWVDFKPDFDNMRVALNARLFDDFDVEALPVEVIDGRNLW